MGTVSFSSSGSDFAARMRVFTGTALATLTPATTTRNVLADGTEVALFSADSGTTYRIVVGGQPFSQYDSGRLSLRWQMVGGFGDRDAFSQAVAISGATGMLAGANVAATKEPGEPDHCANDGGASVWFAWPAPTTGRYRFSMVPGTLVMGCVSVYQGSSVSALNLVAGDPWNDPPPANARVAVFDAIAGTQFRIVVDGLMCEDGPPVCTHPAQGSFTLTWAPAP